MARKTKRILVVSDLHSGHHKGLTHPDWHWSTTDNPYRQSVYEFQKWSWGFYDDIIQRGKPFDIMLINGDAIDGKGDRSGGTELLTSDREEQADIASSCINHCKAQKKLMTYGTPYHTGNWEDWENAVARNVKASIHGHAYIDVNGVVISLKHKIGNSSVPHGKGTAILKQQVWNDAWCRAYKDHPNAQVFIRSHVHWFMSIEQRTTLSIVTPALQGMGSKYGARQCDSVVDFGAIILEITPAGSITCKSEIATLQGQPVETISL